MQGFDVYWRITDKCNLSCRHCCYECGPEGETVSTENAKRIIQNLPEKLEILTLTGGEPMLETRLLEEILTSIKLRDFPHLHTLKLQTNGFWVEGEEPTYRTLERLSEWGINQIEFASYDRFHMERGIKIDNLILSSDERHPLTSAVKKLAGKRKYIEIFIKGGHSIKPFGRAKNLNPGELTQSYCFLKEVEYNIATIDPKGEVYPCCYQRPYSIGNATITPLIEIFEKSKNDRVLLALRKGDLRDIAKENGLEPYFNIACHECDEFFSVVRKR